MGRLLQVELTNFKSYRGHHVIGPFNQHFCCVIGPNGSGKSNLMDAISFVLGVNSSSLRSESLLHLVNNYETDNATADVTAVYVKTQDEDEETFRLSRTITPAGVSEYKIDGKKVTYKVYNKFLEGENVLVNARNFLVFQGDVEAVASQSSKQLAKLIEQISGSILLQKQYEETKQQLNAATETSTLNFSKKRNINAEMKSFREQKEEADRFTQKSKLLRSTVVTHRLWKLYHLERNIKNRSQEIETEKEQIDDDEIIQLDEMVKSRKKEVVKSARRVAEMEKIIAEKTKELDKLEEPVLDALKKKTHFEKKIRKARENVAKMKENLKEQETGIVELENLRTGVIRAKQVFEDSVEERESRTGPVLSTADAAEYRRLKEQLSRATTTQTQLLPGLRRQLKAANEKKQRGVDTKEVLIKRIDELNDKLKMLNDRSQRLRVQKDEITSEYDTAKQEFDKAVSDRRKLAQISRETQEKLVHIESQLDSLSSERNENDREQRFKQMIDTLKKAFPGVHGRIMDLCKPTQRKFDLAIGIVLGRNADSIVVDSQAVAVQCIQYLRDHRLGQATFLPLDTLSVKNIDDKYRNYAKGARLAIDVIQYDAALFEKAMLLACGNALVCDTLEIAKFICYEKQQQVKAVSLDGTLIHKAGLITGGVSKDMKARRWDDKDVDEMKSARNELREKYEEIQREARKGANEDVLREAVSAAQSRLQSIIDDLEQTRRKAQEVEKELAHLGREQSRINEEIKAETDLIESKNTQLSNLDAEVEAQERVIFASFCRKIGVESIREYEQTALKKVDEVLQKRADFENQLSKLSQQIEFDKEKISETKKLIVQSESAIQKYQQELDSGNDEYTKQIEMKNGLSEEIKGLDETLQERKAVNEESNKTFSDTKKRLTKKIKQHEEKLKYIATQEANLEKMQLDRVEILRKSKLEEVELPVRVAGNKKIVMLNTLDNLDMGLEEEDTQSQIPIDSVEADYSKLSTAQKSNGADEMDIEFTETIKNLTVELERMAPNMKAVDRLDDVEIKLRETATEFENARKDAKNAKERFNTIKEERTKKFTDAFNHISSKIDVIYKELTRSKTFKIGGTAYLSLEAGDEPYLQGVKYHAMPPMKRFRDMEQLSGGEKTVAALALLFAIHSYRPSPFFVLDEVDAALDNTNVAKVANYIRRHANDSMQFIVISLKATFYEKAGALLGIYRDVEGKSSKVLSLQLDERFED